jgi:hypothetical protein
VQKIHSSGVLLYVVALNFYSKCESTFVVKHQLERGEAPIGQIPVWVGGTTVITTLVTIYAAAAAATPQFHPKPHRL